jgi:predicted DNA-binding transcriptional regulator AlpA
MMGPPFAFDPAAVPEEQIPAVIATFGAWQTQLAARLMSSPATVSAPEVRPDEESDRPLTTVQVAEMLGHSTKWVYRHVKNLPFARRIGPRDYRFSLLGLRKWQARQRV